MTLDQRIVLQRLVQKQSCSGNSSIIIFAYCLQIIRKIKNVLFEMNNRQTFFFFQKLLKCSRRILKSEHKFVPLNRTKNSSNNKFSYCSLNRNLTDPMQS